MPHPGLLLFGACAVVAVAVVVIEEWPTIKETYNEVRARRRRRMVNAPHETQLHHHTVHVVDEPMTASGFHEPVQQQEMTMRSRNVMDGKNGIQVIKPFAIEPSTENDLIPSVQQRDESSTLFPISAQDVSTLIHRTASPSKPNTPPPPSESFSFPDPVIIPVLINPLDRPSSPEPEDTEDPFADPIIPPEDLESIPLSRTTSHTLSLHRDDDENSMSDWTEAFDNQTDTEGLSDMDSDSDIVSDAESEASWARVRSRGVGFN